MIIELGHFALILALGVALVQMLLPAWTARTLARNVTGRLLPNSATAAPKTARISTHSSIEPSWFPHTPEIL